MPQPIIQARPSIELHPDIKPNGASEAVTPIRWCVTKALTDKLARLQIAKPFLLISVRPFHEYPQGDGSTERHYHRETKRYVVPLTQEMQYVSFSRHGSNAVTACVVWNKDGYGASEMAAVFLDEGKYGYNETLFSQDNAPLYGHFSHQTGRYGYDADILADVTHEVEVYVAPEMFAPEPAQWIKDWTGKFTRRGDFDQCVLKKRLLLTAPLLPFYLLLSYMARILQVAVGAIFGLRDMSFAGFLRPMHYGPFDVLDKAETSIWFQKKDTVHSTAYKTVYKPRYPMQYFFNPLTIIAIASVLFTVGSVKPLRKFSIIRRLSGGWRTSLAHATLGVVLIGAVILLVTLLATLASLVFGNIHTERLKVHSGRLRRFSQSRRSTYRIRRDLEEAEAKQRNLRELDRELAAMVCTTDTEVPQVSLAALPKRKQTFHLRYQATKQKKCKPFAR